MLNVDSVMSLNRFQICVRGDFQHFASSFLRLLTMCFLMMSGHAVFLPSFLVSGLCFSVNRCTSISRILLCELGSFYNN